MIVEECAKKLFRDSKVNEKIFSKHFTLPEELLRELLREGGPARHARVRLFLQYKKSVLFTVYIILLYPKFF